MRTRGASIIVCCLVAITGCSLTSTQQEISSAVTAERPETPSTWTAVQESVGEVQIGWIEAIGDEALTALVREAQANNKDLRAAAANVDRSWALAKKAGAALTPSIDLAAGGDRSGFVDGPAGNAFNLGLQASWEIDVWGRIRSGELAAEASAQAVEADYRFSQHSLAAAVAGAYFVAVEAGIQAAVARRSVEALTETDRLVNLRFAQGYSSRQDQALARSDLATAEAELAAAEGSRRDALRALEVLLGRYPSADVEVREAMPTAPAGPPAGVPSEALERRPDLIAAERRVAAAFFSVDQAKAARLPAIGLTASTGGSSSELRSLLDPSNVAWSVGGNLLAPLIDGGARQADVEIATAEQQEALAAYGQAALNAFQEVETGLDRFVVLGDRQRALTEAAEQANQAFRVAQRRFDAGDSDLLDTLTVQRRVFSADSGLASVERLRLEQWVNLNLALGGSW
jgi:NodT family efflux transporter outer membrane factor (OMF) lipoprotein